MVTISSTPTLPNDITALNSTKNKSLGDTSVITSNDAVTPSSNTDTVSLSGKSLMISRLFSTDPTNYTEAVSSKDDLYAPLSHHLTTSDRDMLGEMYQYASDNNIDLKHVDAFAEDLGAYRAVGITPYGDQTYDLQGHKMTVTLKPSEATVSQNIIDSGKIGQSTIDQGFLASEVGGKSGHMVNLEFLQKVISVFSSNSDVSTQAKNSESAIAKYSFELSRPDVTFSKDIQFATPEADYSSVNGVGTWRTPELATANSVQSGTQSKTNQVMSFLREFALHKKIDNNTLTELQKLLEKSVTK